MTEIMSGKGPILMLMLFGAVLFQTEAVSISGQGGPQTLTISKMHNIMQSRV